MSDPFYALVELMGHQKLVGYASWQPGGMLRVEPVKEDGTLGPTRHYGPGALFCVYPCSEDVARATAATHCGSFGNEGERTLPYWATERMPAPPPDTLNGIPAPVEGMQITLQGPDGRSAAGRKQATVHSVDIDSIVVDVHDSGGSTMSIPVKFWSDKDDSWLVCIFDKDGVRIWLHDSEIPF